MASTRCPVSGDGQGRFYCFQVPHLADQNHVRVLAQDVLEGVGKAVGVCADLSLVDHGQLVGMQVFDRVFDGHDVQALFRINLVDDRREGRRFSGARRARNKHKTTGFVGKLHNAVRDAKLIEGSHGKRNAAKRTGHGAALVIQVGPKARESPHAERYVEFLVRFEQRLLLLR